jgi:hypothetical protein
MDCSQKTLTNLGLGPADDLFAVSQLIVTANR